MKQEESKDDSIKRSNEFELQAATQGPIRNDRHTHTCTRGIGHHVFSCYDIGRLINRIAAGIKRLSAGSSPEANFGLTTLSAAMPPKTGRTRIQIGARHQG
jgi:hypothetical protein